MNIQFYSRLIKYMAHAIYVLWNFIQGTVLVVQTLQINAINMLPMVQIKSGLMKKSIGYLSTNSSVD